MRAGVAVVLGLALLLLPAARSGRAEEPPSAERTSLDALLDTLEPALGSIDAKVRVDAERQLLSKTAAVEVFPRLVEIAKAPANAAQRRAALEALSRLAAPSMVARHERGGGGGARPGMSGEDLLRSQARYPLRILPSVGEKLTHVIPGFQRVRYADSFVGLATITQLLDVAFGFDPEKHDVVVMTPEEAVARHTGWLRGPGAETLAWADFLRAQEGVAHDALNSGEIDIALAQLLGEDPAARRRAAYVLGRSSAAGPALRKTVEAVSPAQRERIEPVLARHELRAHGDVAFVSPRSGSPELFWMRWDGARIERLTSEAGLVFMPEPSPDGRHVAYHHEFGDRLRRFAVLDLETRKLWRPAAGEAAVRAWSPDGRYLAFVSGAGVDRSMHLLDTTTGTERDLGIGQAPPRLGHPSPPTWSPNGRRMVYPVEGQLISQELPDGERHVLAHGTYRNPLYLGEDLLVVRHELGRDTLVRMTADGNTITYPRPDEELIQEVTVSPDATRAVLATLWGNTRDHRKPGVYLLDLTAESSLRRLGEGTYPRLRWSPAGDKLAIDLAYNTVSILDADGEALCDPRRGIGAGSVRWGPQGEVFHAAELLPLEQPASVDRLQHRSRLLRWRAGTWEAVRPVEGILRLLGGTPDGRWLFLESDATGDSELVAASTDDRHWLSLTEHPAEDHTATPMPIPAAR